MQHDVLVIGGSFAGLAAATALARARRSVCIVDHRRPRNRFAAAAHGFISRDGSAPGSILAAAREQLGAYPTVRMIEGEAVAAGAVPGGFAATLANGTRVTASKVVLAFGLSDGLPDLPGLRERWGVSVLHCPYCHGLEFGDRPLGVLYRAPLSVHQALIVAEWGPVTLYLNGAALDRDAEGKLTERGIALEPEPVVRLTGEGSALGAVELASGRRRETEALYIAPEPCLASPIAEALGCAVTEGLLGPMVATDADRMTTVPGIYAAGDIARAPHNVTWAAADGVTAGMAAHRALVFGG